jgi:hypothetical protein
VVTSFHFGIEIAKNLLLDGLYSNFLTLDNKESIWRICNMIVSMLGGIRFCT